MTRQMQEKSSCGQECRERIQNLVHSNDSLKKQHMVFFMFISGCARGFWQAAARATTGLLSQEDVWGKWCCSGIVSSEWVTGSPGKVRPDCQKKVYEKIVICCQWIVRTLYDVSFLFKMPTNIFCNEAVVCIVCMDSGRCSAVFFLIFQRKCWFIHL